MKKIKIEQNGFVLWYRSRFNGKVAYAKQYQATSGLDYGLEDDKNPLTNPVYVAFDGAEQEDLIRVLEDRDYLKSKVERLEKELEESNCGFRDIINNDVYSRLDRLETKKWYQFWK